MEIMTRITIPTAKVIKPINGSKYAANPPITISCPSISTDLPILGNFKAGNSFLASFENPMTIGNRTSAN
ncbi:hypothetical protein D3C79_1044910 [compost metagenome]